MTTQGESRYRRSRGSSGALCLNSLTLEAPRVSREDEFEEGTYGPVLKTEIKIGIGGFREIY
jgi:hypothetical protein